MSTHLEDATLQQLAEAPLQDAGAQAAAERHLAECPRCAAALEGYRALFSDLNQVPVVEAPAAMAEAVLSAYERAAQPIPALWSDRKLLIAFALFNLMLLAVIGGVIGLSGPLDLISSWALGLGDVAVSVTQLLPAVKAIWTAMAHGGMVLVLALALMLVATVAALRRTVMTVEETP